jgi:hypothetical protein
MHTGKYDFEPKRKKKFSKHVSVTVQGEWSAYLASHGYLSKILADEVSYVWDRVISLFSQNIIDGTSVAILGKAPDARLSERGLRFMALEDRFSRRMLGEALSGALKAANEIKQDRFTRVMLPPTGDNNTALAYILMILAYPTELEAAGGLPGGYEQYRETRARILEAYCLVLLSEQRRLKTAVGIAVDASSMKTGRRGGSEDLMAIQVDEWTGQLLTAAAEAKERYDVLRVERLVESHLSGNEYPSVAGPSGNPRNRKPRRQGGK